jgi:hypothetical protein
MIDREPPAKHRSVCAFCGECERMSREHVFPQWIAAALPGPGAGGFLAERVSDLDALASWKAAKPNTQVRIGKACNEGWMSLLEDRAKPILSSLINPTRRRTTLSLAAQDLIALWVAKTTYMADLSNAVHVVPASCFRALYVTREPPSDMRIWLSAYDAKHAIHMWSQAMQVGPVSDRDRVDGYVMTVTLGCLVFQVAHFFDADVGPAETGQDALLVPVWPRQGRSQFWPAGLPGGPNGMNDETLARFAGRFGGDPPIPYEWT